jgi:hypothetical protein
MRVIIKKKIGKSEVTFEASADKYKDALFQAAFYANTPDKCTICHSEDVILDANRTQEGYLYVKVRCLNPECGARATMGEYRDGSGGFWKQFEKYDPNATGAKTPAVEKKEETPAATAEAKKVEPSDDFPF